jgi:hypothetical protein
LQNFPAEPGSFAFLQFSPRLGIQPLEKIRHVGVAFFSDGAASRGK